MNEQNQRMTEWEKEELFDACQGLRGDRETIARILSKYPSTSITSVRDEMGLTPLHHAARFGFADVVKDLVEKYCGNVEVKDTLCGLTPLHYAAHSNNGCEEVMQLLIQRYSADVKSKTNNGDTPLHTAAFHGNEAATDALITQFNLNVHQQNYEGKTPLHLAVRRGHKTYVATLIQKFNADPQALDNKGCSPFAFSAMEVPSLDTPQQEASASQESQKFPERKAQTLEDKLAQLKELSHSIEDDCPHEYLCPITQEIMVKPVVAFDGWTYESSVIMEWLERQNTSPMTMKTLKSLQLIPNKSLRSGIYNWIEKQLEHFGL